MDIENPLRKLLHEPGREQPHVAGEANEIDIILLQRGSQVAVVLFARLAFRWNHQRIQPTRTRCDDARRICFIGNDNRNARVGNTARINTVSDSDEIRAASGEENAEGMHEALNDKSTRRLRKLVVNHFPLTFHYTANGVSLFSRALQNILRFLELRQRNDQQHSYPHVERAHHFIQRNITQLPQMLE